LHIQGRIRRKKKANMNPLCRCLVRNGQDATINRAGVELTSAGTTNPGIRT
jgi:hypothetical protein